MTNEADSLLIRNKQWYGDDWMKSTFITTNTITTTLTTLRGW